MASKRSRGQSSQGQGQGIPANLRTHDGDHVFLRFTQHPDNDREALKDIRLDVEELKKRHVEIGRTLDWDFLDDLRAKREIKSFLPQELLDESGNIVFSCNAWETALDLKEPIYKELMIEFIASYEFDEGEAREDRTVNCIKYRLGGHWKKMSLNEFGIALGLYTEAQTRTAEYNEFMNVCEFWRDERASLASVWTELGIGNYRSSDTKVINLKYPNHRVIHRMIVNTVNQRKSSHDKVDRDDLWILNQIVDDNRFTNVPFVVARMLSKARGYRERSGLLAGQYISRLARSHGILTERVKNSLTFVGEMGLIGETQLYGMKAVLRDREYGKLRTSWNRGFVEQVQEEEMPQPMEGEASGSHQAPPDWNAYEAYQGLQERFDQFSIDQAEANRRAGYLQMQTLRQVDWQSNAMNQFFGQANPPFHPRPPYQPPVMWPHDQPNPPNFDSFDAWQHQDFFGPN